jgi:transposase
MRSKGSAEELERRRILGIRRLLDGYSADEVADFLGVDVRSVWRWWHRFQRTGWAGLAAQSVGGRPSKLTPTQAKIVFRWLRESPTEHGFSTELWTAARLGVLIHEEWDVTFNRRYLSAWLRAQGYTPQRPQRIPRERDPEAIAAWLANDWPRIKKKRADKKLASFSSTKAGS